MFYILQPLCFVRNQGDNMIKHYKITPHIYFGIMQKLYHNVLNLKITI